ncbi:MAG TPA: helix-turn-helix domain-containing protein, partial [Clostridia bacterium]|nr:helix-turn-helix domain-containing protein [Clostridia bacterium]
DSATTNRNLEQSVQRREFRQDLFFRLNVVPIQVLPLRERREDIAILAQEFMARFGRKHGVQVRGFAPETLQVLKRHSWPGNVRELQNVVERAVILCGDNGVLDPEHLGLTGCPSPAAPEPNMARTTSADDPTLTLGEIEKRHILTVLEQCNGNRTQAAKLLDVSVRTLRNKLHEYNGSQPSVENDEEALETV